MAATSPLNVVSLQALNLAPTYLHIALYITPTRCSMLLTFALATPKYASN